MAVRKVDKWLEPDSLILIEGWARDGLTQADIAHNMGVNEHTLTTWKRKYPALDTALKRGKDVVDRIVENALFKRAIGYDYVEKTTITETDATGYISKQTEKEITKHVPGDTTAQIFWLKNRKPEDWRDKRVQQAASAEGRLSDALDLIKDAVTGDGADGS